MGRFWAPLLLVKQDSLPAETSAFIDNLSANDECFVLGGTNSVNESVRLTILARLLAQ